MPIHQDRGNQQKRARFKLKGRRSAYRVLEGGARPVYYGDMRLVAYPCVRLFLAQTRLGWWVGSLLEDDTTDRALWGGIARSPPSPGRLARSPSPLAPPEFGHALAGSSWSAFASSHPRWSQARLPGPKALVTFYPVGVVVTTSCGAHISRQLRCQH